MKHCLAFLCLLGTLLVVLTRCTVPASQFQLDGDYFIGGLFGIHSSIPVYHERPESIHCSSKPFQLTNYRRFQLMRFAVEEINNSTHLLPNVTLGYEMFDLCSDTRISPEILKLISVDGLIQPWAEDRPDLDRSKVIAVVGPFASTAALTVAPLFMADFIPMVSYGSSSSVFSNTEKFPSFLRTVHPNKDTLGVVVTILQHFNWRWVAFLHSEDDFGTDGRNMFIEIIKDTNICLAYSKEKMAETLIMSAIKLNITNKVWIAMDTWSSNKLLPLEEGIKNIGTVLGVSQQVCNCSSHGAEEILDTDPSFSFPVYSSVYAIAHALHNVLECGFERCNDNITVFPHMVLAEIKRLNFTLLNTSVEFTENGNPNYGSYSIVYWNRGKAEMVGFYSFHPTLNFFINNSQIKWHDKGQVPISLCSEECSVGYVKEQNGIHKCCFTCTICQNGTYINSTADPYKCIHCKETEWSAPGSTSCNLRSVEYIPFTDSGAIVIMVGAVSLEALTAAVAVLFAINYNTPVVRSAGGPMCFLILGCLSLSSLSVFFYFGIPTSSFCILRFLPFVLFYTVCLACFVVRSFQIVCIFKMAAKFPKLHSWWMKYNGQWLIVTVAFVTQTFLLFLYNSQAPPKPYNDTQWSPESTILTCDINLGEFFGSVIPLVFMCSFCFVFSYMGKDLPKNYNEAKAITFCLLLLIFTWVIFTTIQGLYKGKYIQILNAMAVLSSLFCFLLFYFLPKCYIIILQPQKNTQQHFQAIIQNYTKTLGQ